MRCFALPSLFCLFASAATAAAQETPLDLIPGDAAGAIILRHPNDLKNKGDKLLADANLEPGIRPTQLLDMLVDFLGIRAGVDWDRPGGAVLLRPHDGEQIGLKELENNLYAVIPFTDLEKMAGNFDIPKGSLQAGKIVKIQNRFVNYAMARDKHIYLAVTEAPLKRIAKATPITGKLTAAQKKSNGQADVLVHVGPRAFRDEWMRTLDEFERAFDRVEDASEKAALSNLTRSLVSVDFGLISFTVGDGIAFSILASFDKAAKEPRELLADIRADDKTPSDLKGLPEGNVVIAQAFGGKGAKSALIARTFLSFFLKNFLELGKLTSAADRPAFVGVFHEVWQRLQGHRIGVYLTSNESKLGLFSLVAILDTADPHKFLAEMRVLARIGDGAIDLTKKDQEDTVDIEQLVRDLGNERYPARASATTKLRLLGEPALPYLKKTLAATDTTLEVIRRAEKLIVEISTVAAERRRELLGKDLPSYVRPTFAWVAKAERRQGEAIDIVHIKLQNTDKRAVETMKQYFGPDWDKMRLAVVGKQLAVFLGSETELFDQTVKNLKEGQPGLAASKTFAGFRAHKPANASGEFHASVGTLLALVTGGREALRNTSALSSFSLAIGVTDLQLDLNVPTAELRVIGKRLLP